MLLGGALLRSIKSGYRQVTLTKITVLFFLLNFFPCIAQGLVESFLFTDDANAATLVSQIIQVAQVPTDVFPWLARNGDIYTLQLCSHTPGSWGNGSEPCVTVFQNGKNITLPSGYRRSDDAGPIAQEYFAQGLNLTKSSLGVNMTFDDGLQSVILGDTCTRALLYPAQVFVNSRTESIALIGLQFWMLGITIFSLITESIPHILALFAMRVLSVGWSSYTIWRTLDIETRLDHLIYNPGDSACKFDLFRGYFGFRVSLQIPELVISCLGLIASGYLGWHLIRRFNEHTFKRVGPPPNIVRMHRYMMAVLVCLHLCLYLTATALGLWTQQLLHGAVAAISSFTNIYLALVIFILTTLVPWTFLGNYAIKREKKKFMAVFLLFALAYIVSWSLMFDSEVYRWTWIQWPFFASCTISAFIAVIASGVFGVVCWLQFGAGLAHYLYVEEILAESDFKPDKFKVDTGQEQVSSPRSGASGDPDKAFFKRDMNWDFIDVELQRPSIYIMELQDPQKLGPPPIRP